MRPCGEENKKIIIITFKWLIINCALLIRAFDFCVNSTQLYGVFETGIAINISVIIRLLLVAQRSRNCERIGAASATFISRRDSFPLHFFYCIFHVIIII